jgi:hypothetical protein
VTGSMPDCGRGIEALTMSLLQSTREVEGNACSEPIHHADRMPC